MEKIEKEIPLEDRVLAFGPKITATKATELIVEKLDIPEMCHGMISDIINTYDNAHEGAEEIYSAIREGYFREFVDKKLDIEPDCSIADLLPISLKHFDNHVHSISEGREDPHLSVSNSTASDGSDGLGEKEWPNVLYTNRGDLRAEENIGKMRTPSLGQDKLVVSPKTMAYKISKEII